MAKFLDLDGLKSYNGKLNQKLDQKFVAQEEGKGLSSNDFTDEYMQKIVTLEESKSEAITEGEIAGLFEP